MKEIVYKQDTIDALWKAEKELPYYDSAQVAVNVIKELPSAQSERKKGKWIDGAIPTYAVCSECAYQEGYAYENNYCPNCGADMRGEQE